MLELLVAMACTGLLAAALLALMVDGARTYRSRDEMLESAALARAGVDALVRELDRAGEGLEGARGISLAGESIPIARVGRDRATVVIPAGSSREADALPGGDLWLGDVAGLGEGDLVAALGIADPLAERPVAPAGWILEVERERRRGPSGGRVRIRWAPPEAARLDEAGPPRAILPVAVRELATRATSEGLQLRRRDLGGRWQPAVDFLEFVRLEVLPFPEGAGGGASGGGGSGGGEALGAGAVVGVGVRARFGEAVGRTARATVRVR